MKSILYVMALSLSLLPLAGCETLTDTPAENGNRVARAIDTNGKEIPDDTERLLLLDRPSWLSDRPIPYR
ncbi:MAG TPA: hypothetical protein VM008_14415 [Phycisphaerae bacterium]|nr:hypothetical protein [Phycisphaerae bacterium]